MIAVIVRIPLYILFFSMKDECFAKVAPPVDITKNFKRNSNKQQVFVLNNRRFSQFNIFLPE